MFRQIITRYPFQLLHALLKYIFANLINHLWREISCLIQCRGNISRYKGRKSDTKNPNQGKNNYGKCYREYEAGNHPLPKENNAVLIIVSYLSHCQHKKNTEQNNSEIKKNIEQKRMLAHKVECQQ